MAYRVLTLEMRLLFWLLAVGYAYDLFSLIALFYALPMVSWGAQIFTLVEFLVITYIFYCWENSRTIRKILKYSAGLFVLVWLGLKFTIEPLSGANDTISLPLSASFLSAFALNKLTTLSRDQDVYLLHEYQFWISAAILFYYAGSLLIIPLAFVVEQWGIHNALLTAVNLLYIGGFSSARKSKTGGS